MATIVLQVPDENIVAKVKQACKMLMGVTSVKVHRQATAQTKMHDVTQNFLPQSDGRRKAWTCDRIRVIGRFL